MERPHRRGLILAVAAAAILGIGSWRPTAADSEPDRAPDPLILGAQADLDRGTLTISGLSLGSAANPPAVALGGHALVVLEASAQTVVAELPAEATPGTHLLVVARGLRSDRFAALIPASGLVTPAGILVESTGADVRIKAGNSHVTIDRTGGIVIESTGALKVTSAGALDLKGRTVTLTSDTSLAIRGLTVDVNGTATTAIRASGAVSVAGGTVAVTGTPVTLN
jgi:hypothetical protein